MISVSTKMPYQEVREISLRSRESTGKVEDESRKKVATLSGLHLKKEKCHFV